MSRAVLVLGPSFSLTPKDLALGFMGRHRSTTGFLQGCILSRSLVQPLRVHSGGGKPPSPPAAGRSESYKKVHAVLVFQPE